MLSLPLDESEAGWGGVLRLSPRLSPGGDQQHVVQQSYPVVHRSRYAVVEAVGSASVQVRAQDGRGIGVDKPPAIRGVAQERLLEEPVVVVEGRVLVALGRGVDEGESDVEIDGALEHPEGGRKRLRLLRLRCGAVWRAIGG